jgi:hypothetical protein
MSADTATRAPRVGAKVELARYTVKGVERILYSQVIDGLVRVTDHPASGRGRSYLVEPALKCDGHLALQALVTDYTSTARRVDEIPMRATLDPPVQQVELARYALTRGERVLYGQRVNGVVRVTDRPARGSGRAYLVECGLERDGYGALKALIDDYIRQACKHDEIPMLASHVSDTGRATELEKRRGRVVAPGCLIQASRRRPL